MRVIHGTFFHTPGNTFKHHLCLFLLFFVSCRLNKRCKTIHDSAPPDFVALIWTLNHLNASFLFCCLKEDLSVYHINEFHYIKVLFLCCICRFRKIKMSWCQIVVDYERNFRVCPWSLFILHPPASRCLRLSLLSQRLLLFLCLSSSSLHSPPLSLLWHLILPSALCSPWPLSINVNNHLIFTPCLSRHLSPITRRPLLSSLLPVVPSCPRWSDCIQMRQEHWTMTGWQTVLVTDIIE